MIIKFFKTPIFDMSICEINICFNKIICKFVIWGFLNALTPAGERLI